MSKLKMCIFSDIHYYIVGSLVENINSDGIPDGAYLEVELDDDYINVKEKHLDYSK